MKKKKKNTHLIFSLFFSSSSSLLFSIFLLFLFFVGLSLNIFYLLLFGSFNLHLVKTLSSRYSSMFNYIFSTLSRFQSICFFFFFFFFIMIYFSNVKDLIVFSKICQDFCFIGKKEMERSKIKRSAKLTGDEINNFYLGFPPQRGGNSAKVSPTLHLSNIFVPFLRSSSIFFLFSL
jgi:hypothetical protein